MARSSYIYVILNPTLPSADCIIATFTVKHECQSFIEDTKGKLKRDWIVLRYPDSPYEREAGVPVTFDA